MTAALKATPDGSPITRPPGVGTVTASINPALDGNDPLAPESIRRVRIGPAVEARLRRSGYLALRDVSCDVRAGTVRLHGQLPTYYLKQVAQEVVDTTNADLEGPGDRPPAG